jgi:hypothetical protein
MALEKRLVALVGDAVKDVDLGDKAVPILPKTWIASISKVPLLSS